MYELIVSNRGQSYCVFGETLNKADYPTIEIGSSVFVPSLDKMLLVLDEETFVDVKTGAVLETEEETPVEPTPEEIPDESGTEDPEEVVDEGSEEPAETAEE